MPIAPGSTLLHYRIADKLGEGGMGVVWRATDTTLDREVAIKVLPEAFAGEGERLGRFEREAKLLASLNHPNIAAIHGLHHADGVHFLAMELVEGEDLAERLQRGPLPLDEALDVARQIAEALDGAHERGVVHRDLKPANVKLAPDGKVKVLDFGLAKAMSPESASGSADPALSPTMTSAGTVAGMILGTAAYMSPEQARGRTVDRRTDLWSFGCLLYECLAGVQLFAGETISDSLAAVLRKEPDWSALPAQTPPAVRRLLERCLNRDPRKRQQDAGSARLTLEEAIADPQASAEAATTGATALKKKGLPARLPWAVAALAVVAAGWIASRDGDPAAPAAEIARRLYIPVPGATEFGDTFASPPAISPDGRFVVFGVEESGQDTRLWLRPLDDFESRPLAGTEGANYAFWSADSRHIGYFRAGKLRRIEVATGREQAIGGEGSSYPRGGSWNRDGQIIYAPNSNAGIHLIDAAGGEPRQITTLDPDIPDGSHRWPHFLPDGDRFLFTLWTNDLQARDEVGGVYLTSLSGRGEPKRILADPSRAVYAEPGRLVVLRGGNLVVLPFDLNAQQVTGEPRVLASGVLYNRSNGHASFSASAEGTLVYASGTAFLPSTLRWYDRDGNSTPAPGEPDTFLWLRLSSDSSRAGASIPGANGDGEIWMLDLIRGVRTRVAYGKVQYDYPVFSADGRQLLYGSQELGAMDMMLRAADGSGAPTVLLADEMDKVIFDWSRDGRHVAYWPMGSGGGTSDVWIYTIDSGKNRPLIQNDATHRYARFSPDGKWLAYVSDDGGRQEIFVHAFDGDADELSGARIQVSTAGGSWPSWRDDGREIVYIDLDRRMIAVSVDYRDGVPVFGSPQPLFAFDDEVVAGDATGDHQRFLFATRADVQSEPLHVILDWPADL